MKNSGTSWLKNSIELASLRIVEQADLRIVELAGLRTEELASLRIVEIQGYPQRMRLQRRP